MAPASGHESWRVRVRDGDMVRGAGVLLGNAHVLTCAHVVAGAGRILIDFAGGTSAGARIIPECLVPPLSDGRGDVALLELARPQADGIGATLTLTDLYFNQPVRTHGFPDGLADVGVYTRATLRGRGRPPGDEWLQLNGNAHEHPIERGFSGAGVVDEQTGAVLGIVVSVYTDRTHARLAWMLPVRTIVRHLPVRKWVTRARDEPPVPFDIGGLLVIVLGRDRDLLRRMIAMSSGELLLSADDAPEPGSVDLALDASGKSVDEVAQRIVEQAGGPGESTDPREQVRAGVRPMTIAIDGVDAAEHPEALMTDVVAPLLRGDSRLLLGFADESSPSLMVARDLASVDHRLARLDERLTALWAAEREVEAKQTHVRDETTADTGRAEKLRPVLTLLRQADSSGERFRHRLARFERMVAEAVRRLADHARHLDDLLAEREEWRGRLKAYKAKAVDSGRAEDLELSVRYHAAYELLWHSPTDMPAARQALRDYERGVRA